MHDDTAAAAAFNLYSIFSVCYIFNFNGIRKIIINQRYGWQTNIWDLVYILGVLLSFLYLPYSTPSSSPFMFLLSVSDHWLRSLTAIFLTVQVDFLIHIFSFSVFDIQVEGTLSVQPQANPVVGFEQHFLGLTVENNRRNPWFVGKWAQIFNAYLSFTFKWIIPI